MVEVRPKPRSAAAANLIDVLQEVGWVFVDAIGASALEFFLAVATRQKTYSKSRSAAGSQHVPDAVADCRDTPKWALIHSRCNLWGKGEPNLLKLLGVQTFSVASSMTLNSAAPPDRILTRSPPVTACRGRDLAPRLKQSPNDA